MKARFMFWTGIHPNNMPVKEVLVFNEHAEEILEETAEMLRNTVAAGVADVIEEMDFK